MRTKLDSDGPFWVVTAPFKRIFDTYPECLDALKGAGAHRQMKVQTRAEADAILSGRGVVLPRGLYVFTDGNAMGGVGVVLVEMANDGDEPVIRDEIAASVAEVFDNFEIAGLDSPAAIEAALTRCRNVLAEMAGLYLGIRRLPARKPATVVHDYEGVGAWMDDGLAKPWRKAKDPVLGAVVSACRVLRDEKGIELSYRQQRGHRSDWAGRHDFARFNRLADELATQGVSSR